MRVLGALLVAAVAFAVTIFMLAGGFSRFRSAAPATRSSAQADGGSRAPAPPRPPETNPSKLLFRALDFRDADEVIKILTEHPEAADKEIDHVRPLWRACEWGELRVVKAFVEKGANVNVKNRENHSILWAAVLSKKEDVVKYLIEKGADPKALQDDKETLLWAAQTRSMAQLLINAGVDPKAKNIYNDTALHEACRNCLLDVVAVLLDNGIDIEAKGKWDMRPIHSSASSISGDSRPVLKLLLERGAKIDAKGFEGQTALHECALYNRYDNAVLLLSRGADINALDDNKKTPLDKFDLAKSDRIKLYNLFVKHEGKNGSGVAGQLIPENKDE
jgi:ankyrin repeat protein